MKFAREFSAQSKGLYLHGKWYIWDVDRTGHPSHGDVETLLGEKSGLHAEVHASGESGFLRVTDHNVSRRDAASYFLKASSFDPGIFELVIDHYPTAKSSSGTLDQWLDQNPHQENPMSWTSAFGTSYKIPKEILDLVDGAITKDMSWKNDSAPSFGYFDEENEMAVRLFVEHPDEDKRESPDPRFAVYLTKGSEGPVDGTVLITDNVHAAVMHYKELLTAYLKSRQVPADVDEDEEDDNEEQDDEDYGEDHRDRYYAPPGMYGSDGFIVDADELEF